MKVPTKIELSIGETYNLELPGLGASGYLWTHEVVANSDLIDISITTAITSQSSNERISSRVGSSVGQIFIIKAQGVGHTSIRFAQRRPWEQSQSPLKEHILEIDIHN